MDKQEKFKLSESDICDLFIRPALINAGWDPLTQIRREVTLTPGPVIVRGQLASRNKKKKKYADFVLTQKPGLPVAVVEAKSNNFSVSSGLQQALDYAEILDIPSALSSNGDAFAEHNRVRQLASELLPDEEQNLLFFYDKKINRLQSRNIWRTILPSAKRGGIYEQ